MNFLALGLFLLSATALLGSPGPGIASLIAVGRSMGFRRGLVYYSGLQMGLAITAAICAAGLLSVLALLPGLLPVMGVIAALYLLYLAWRIAAAPVGNDASSAGLRLSSFKAGLFLGLSNPKAFLAFAALFASQTIVIGSTAADSFVKWLLIVAVVLVVDLVWLLIGVSLRRAKLQPRSERLLNITLGAMVLVAVLLAFL